MLLPDVLYLRADDHQTSSAHTVGYGFKTKTGVGLNVWIITLAGDCPMVDNGGLSLDLLTGARFLTVKKPCFIPIVDLELPRSIGFDPFDFAWFGD